jgi:hypothetical protein
MATHGTSSGGSRVAKGILGKNRPMQPMPPKVTARGPAREGQDGTRCKGRR